MIVRLRDWSAPTNGRTVGLTWVGDTDLGVTTAHLSDSLERDIRPLDVRDATIEVPLAGHLTTLRISSGPG